jgi:hypothetical protein
MSLKSKWLFIILGDDRTGKTALQKKILKLISGENRDNRLDCNEVFSITHPYLIRKMETISFSNRSFQEKKDIYFTIEQYFSSHFKIADLCIISSHLVLEDVEQMISYGHKMFLNVCGIFMSNSIALNPEKNAQISLLDWDFRICSDNPLTEISDQQDNQLQKIADSFIQMLIQRTLIG